jgi:hypothetical protein
MRTRNHIVPFIKNKDEIISSNSPSLSQVKSKMIDYEKPITYHGSGLADQFQQFCSGANGDRKSH